MSYQPDIVLLDDRGTPIAWVEAKATKIQSAQHWAEFYRLATEIGPPRGVRFLLLVTLVEISLWDWETNSKNEFLRIENLATYSSQLPRFLEEQISRRVATDQSTLVELVFQWLVHIREFYADESDPAEKMLIDVGFVHAIRNARVRFGAAA